jgi:hypothetical protein
VVPSKRKLGLGTIYRSDHSLRPTPSKGVPNSAHTGSRSSNSFHPIYIAAASFVSGSFSLLRRAHAPCRRSKIRLRQSNLADGHLQVEMGWLLSCGPVGPFALPSTSTLPCCTWPVAAWALAASTWPWPLTFLRKGLCVEGLGAVAKASEARPLEFKNTDSQILCKIIARP